MADEYEKDLVKRYRYWSVYLNKDQGFLGRCVVWCDREDALDLALATPEEQAELFTILPALRSAIQQAFGATWFNYSFLGNETRHLHGHLIPRYQKPVMFEGITFEDLNYNVHPSKTGTTNMVKPEVFTAIKSRLISALS